MSFVEDTIGFCLGLCLTHTSRFGEIPPTWYYLHHNMAGNDQLWGWWVKLARNDVTAQALVICTSGCF